MCVYYNIIICNYNQHYNACCLPIIYFQNFFPTADISTHSPVLGLCGTKENRKVQVVVGSTSK